MKKTIDEDTVTDPDFVVNPELLFCSDALVVDYLNALLASEPALNMDFREIHFVHKEITPNSNASSIVTNAMFIESETSKSEADTLRSENENLKFKTELASIDAQVLRNENNRLKIEKERLVAQLSELKDKLISVQAENDSMRRIAETDRHQFDRPAIPVEELTENTPTDLINCAAIATVENILSDLEHTDTDQGSIPEQDMQPEPVEAVAYESRNDNIISITSEKERSIISGTTGPNESAKPVSAPAVTIFSRERSAGGIASHNVQSLSKVVKHHPAEINHSKQSDQIKRVTSPDPVQQEKSSATVDRSPDFTLMQQHHVEETANNQESHIPASNAAIPRLNDVDEITMPDAPSPEVVIRRNVKSYVDLQMESEGVKTPETGHSAKV